MFDPTFLTKIGHELHQWNLNCEVLQKEVLAVFGAMLYCGLMLTIQAFRKR